MLGLSTARDLSISAIISGIFLVKQIVKIQNIQGNIAFFGSRGAEQPIIGPLGPFTETAGRPLVGGSGGT